MDLIIFQKRLRSLINSRGYSITALAPEIGITSATLSRYTTGSRVPDLKCILKIASFFKVSIDWLVGYNGDKYDILPQEVQDIADLYSIATEDDRRVVQAVLNKYRKE